MLKPPVLSLALILLSATEAASRDCDEMDSIYSAELSDGSQILLRQHSIHLSSRKAEFERWKDGRKTWKAEGTMGCSNGASICGLTVETADGQSASAILEVLDTDGDQHSDWYIFGGLSQRIYYRSGLAVAWEPGIEPEDDEPNLVNTYRFHACQGDHPSEDLKDP